MSEHELSSRRSETESLFGYVSSDGESNTIYLTPFSEDEDEDGIFPSKSIPLIKKLMKRLLKISSFVKAVKERIDNYQPGEDTEGNPVLLEDSNRMRELLDLYQLVWGRLLFILHDEYVKCSESYCNSLNMQDRIPFESLAHTIHHSNAFCDLLGEITTHSWEQRVENDEITDEPRSTIISEFREKMLQIQLKAAFCGLLVVEGSHEHYLDPVTIEDLCDSVVKETNPRKRLVPLSLLFSMFGQDTLAISDALVYGISTVLLQRFRHLVHRLFGQFVERGLNEESIADGDILVAEHYRTVVIRSEDNSRRSSHRLSPSAPRSGLTEGLPPQNLGLKACRLNRVPGGATVPDSPLPHTSLSNGTSRMTDSLLTRSPHPKRNRERGDSPLLKRSRCFKLKNDSSLYLSDWCPRVGDKVGRGPGWRYNKQGVGCDYGEVVALVVSNEAIVRWVPSADTQKEHPIRLFRYNYTPPYLEIIPWKEYLRTSIINIDDDMLCLTEFILTSAVLGVLCEHHETVLPALQFQTLESAIHVLDSIDLNESNRLLHDATETVKQAASMLISRIDNFRDEKNITERLLCWDVSVCKARRIYREEREVVVRMGWVLNALLSHKKLALFFLAHRGLNQILKIINGPLDIASAYGCCIVLSKIAKPSIFEELLKNYGDFFQPIMTFIIEQWKADSSAHVQESAGAFLLSCLNFPCALQFFESLGGATLLIDTVENLFKMSEERFDVIFPGLQLIALKCLRTYLTSYLMLSTKVLFRKHRVLSPMITKASPQTSLPRDVGIIDAILFFFSSPTPTLPDVSVENVFSLLVPDHLPALKKMIDRGVHNTFLRCINFYLSQNAWEPLAASLQVLAVLTVLPFVRPLVIEPHTNESGISELLLVVKELHVASHNGNSAREYHLLPCTVTALQILVHLLSPPADGADESALTVFNNTCSDFRAYNGVRTLFEILKIQKEYTFSAKLNFFPVVARVVQLLVVLCRYGDTSLLLESLGVQREAQDLLQAYTSVQREYIAMMSPRKLLGAEYDPAGRFMENVKSLMSVAHGKLNLCEVVKLHHADPLEMEQRNLIISHATIDYSQESLLTLIANHLESQGCTQSAQALRTEARLPTPTLALGDSKVSASEITLDSIIRTYLRQQQEKSPNPIETLPQFDLTKKHIYVSPSLPVDESRNVMNRLLERKLGIIPSLRSNTHSNRLTYRCPAFLFNITGGDDGLQGESVCFCDSGDTLMIGTSDGALALFDTFPEEETREKFLDQHSVFEDNGVSALEVSDNGFLVAAVSRSHTAKIMARPSLSVAKQELENCRAIRFSHDNKLFLATSRYEQGCRLYCLETQQEVQNFVDRNWAGENINTAAVFDYSSSLILHDAVLWDLRCSRKPVFRFDRVTESSSSTFHPSNQIVLIDEKVWDLRSFRMVQTVPAFRKTTSFHINQIGKVIYSFRQVASRSHEANSIVSAVDAYSLEVIFSEETNPPFDAFVLDPSDRYCAAILAEGPQSVVRVFSLSSGPYPSLTGFASQRTQQQKSESDFETGESSETISSYSNYEIYGSENEDEESGTHYTEDEELEPFDGEIEWDESDAASVASLDEEVQTASEPPSSAASSEQST